MSTETISINSKSKEETIPDISFKEMLTNTFNTDFLTEEELNTIADAGELYAKGRIRYFLSQYGDQVVCVETSVDDKLPEPELGSDRFIVKDVDGKWFTAMFDSSYGFYDVEPNEDENWDGITHWLKKTTIKELLNQK